MTPHSFGQVKASKNQFSRTCERCGLHVLSMTREFLEGASQAPFSDGSPYSNDCDVETVKDVTHS